MKYIMASGVLVIVCTLFGYNMLFGNALKTEKPQPITNSRDVSTRNLGTYEKAGPYDLKLFINYEIQAKAFQEIRQFLWEHWKERKLGYITINRYSMEGDKSIYTLYVEPDAEGNWQIISERLIEYRRLGERQDIKTTTIYTEIKRFKKNLDAPQADEVLSMDEISSPDAYFIKLRSKDTKSEMGF